MQGAYKSVVVIRGAGDADVRPFGGGGGLDLAAVDADLLSGVAHGQLRGGDEDVEHVSDHSAHHQRIQRRPTHLDLVLAAVNGVGEKKIL